MSRWRCEVSFRWYDLWIGFYWDRGERTLYFCPLPAVVFKFSVRAEGPLFKEA